MRRGLWWLGLVALNGWACDDGTGASEVANSCVEADLVAQCPVGSNPVVGQRAEEGCADAVGGISLDGEGQAAGQCLGTADCRVLCQFAVACRCGVAEVTREGVTCADCEGAASCGNGLCEGGESPETCPIDCGSVCAPGERRCDGEGLQECSLQGRWDDLQCPGDEVCSVEDGEARCVRDVNIIGMGGGGGAGGGDGGGGGGMPEEGRVIPGAGVLPEIRSVAQGATPERFEVIEHVVRLDDGSVNNRPTAFMRAQVAVAGNAGGNGRIRPAGEVYFRTLPGEEGVEAYSVLGRFRAGWDGGVVIPEVAFTADRAGLCADLEACQRPVEDCDAAVDDLIDELGETQAQCVAEQLAAEGVDACLELFIPDVCGWNPRTPYPDGVEFSVRLLARSGERILGRTTDQQIAAVVDLATETAWRMAPLGEFTLRNSVGHFALSADGRVAALVGSAGQDEVIIIWDVEAGERRPILPISGGSTSLVTLSPGGEVLITRRHNTGDAGADDVLAVWNLATEQRIFSVRAVEGGTLGVPPVVSPDGRHLAIALRAPNQVEIWDIVTQQRLQILDFDGQAPAAGMRFSPDGARLAVAWEGPTLTLWTVADGQRTLTLPGMGLPAFEPDGTRALAKSSTLFRGEFFELVSP